MPPRDYGRWVGKCLCDGIHDLHKLSHNEPIPGCPGAAGTPNAFVAKLNSLGSALIYSTYLGGGNVPDLGGGGSDVGYGIAVDSSGNAYVTGHAANHDFPTTPGSLKPTIPGIDFVDAFVTKLNAAGTALVYSTYLGGSGDDQGNSIAVDTSGNAYITGWTTSPGTTPPTTSFPTVNPIQATRGGGFDAFVTKINAEGSALIYSTYLGGASNDSGYGIAVDSAGNAHVTGYTASSDFPMASPSELNNRYVCCRSSRDSLFGCLCGRTECCGISSCLFHLPGRYRERSGFQRSSGCHGQHLCNWMDHFRQLSYGRPDTNDFWRRLLDVFAAKLNPAGSALVYSTYLGGSGADRGNGIGLDSRVMRTSQGIPVRLISPLQARSR